MAKGFMGRLTAAARAKQSRVVVGLDPRANLLPAALKPAADADAEAWAGAYAAFCGRVCEIVAPYAVAVKPQIAFFEQLGLAGLRAYAEVVRKAGESGLPVIGDVKRGDIGSTAEAYAAGHLDGGGLEVDAITVNPLFGTDGVAPFVRAAAERGKGLFVLVKTSNPSGAEIQDLVCDGRPVYEHVAELVHGWGESVRAGEVWSPVGAVVGATWPEQARRLRELMPHTMFLVPGYGAQGGTGESISAFFGENGEGAVVNASRSVIFAWRGAPWNEKYDESRWEGAVEAAVKAMRRDIEEGLGR
jgi:orotidine-5'-phosphate decarboxylase